MATDKKRIWGWMFFDWASQPYSTLLVTFIFGPYFVSGVMSDAVLAQEYWGWMMAASGAVVAILAPVLGSVVDNHPSKNPWVVAFSVMIVTGSAYLWTAEPDSTHVFWILTFFGIGLVGLELAVIITNSMLPDLGPIGNVGRISGSGWAFGYLGGIIALVIMLLFFAESEAGKTFLNLDPLLGLDAEKREGTRFVGPFSALWYLAFMIPFFLWVKPAHRKAIKGSPAHVGTDNRSSICRMIKDDMKALLNSLVSLARMRSLAAYLVSSMFYRDALSGIFAFGGIYAAGVLGWSITQLGIFGILALVFGSLAAWIGGYGDKWIGPKKVISISVIVLITVALVIISTSLEEVLFIPVPQDSALPHAVFWICGCTIGAMGGSLQASSRTMMVIQAREGRYVEAFGLYALAGKATAFMAPFLIAVTTSLTNDQRLGISPVILLFLIGLVLLIWVQPNGDQNGGSAHD